jgi:hypothetical protein
MTRGQIRAIVECFASLAAVIRGAGLADKAGICRGLSLVLAYEPATQAVHAQAHLNDRNQGYCSCPRSESNQLPILAFYQLSPPLAALSSPDVTGPYGSRPVLRHRHHRLQQWHHRHC